MIFIRLFSGLGHEDVGDSGETIQKLIDLITHALPQILFSQSSSELFHTDGYLLIDSFFQMFLEMFDFLIVLVL